MGKKMHWFSKNIQRGVESINLKSWTRGRELLKCFPYVDEDFDSPFEKIWKLARSNI
jgi:hypothetical protein